MKILTIVGARPQFIKAAAVSRAMLKKTEIQEVLLHTGQHYDADMSDVFFDELEIPAPSYHLGIGSGGHGNQTGRMLAAIEEVLLKEKPGCALVYGDTNSTLAGALAAAKLQITVAHVEAGLRSFNRRMPEEINRVLTDHISSLLFAPTETAEKNLKNEGIEATNIFRVGDVMYDTALRMEARAEATSQAMSRLKLAPKSFVLATIHRAENTDDPARLRTILLALEKVSGEIPVVFPVHPRTQKLLEPKGTKLPGLLMISPVGYLDMVMLSKNAAVVATDSGGLQKEAFFFGTPCVTLREETEWRELAELGWNTVVPPKSPDEIATAILRSVGARGAPGNPFGNGKSSEKIVEILWDRLIREPIGKRP